jgi:hypothetical protein
MERTTRDRIDQLFCVVTEDEPEAYGLHGDYDDEYPRSVVWTAFQRADIRMSMVLQEDVDRAYAEEEPRYFGTAEEFAERFRMAHGVRIDPGSEGFAHISEVVAEVRALMEQRRSNPYYSRFAANDLACPVEQSVFYRSNLWIDRAKAVRAVGRGCTNCGTRNRELHAHHREPIYTAYSRLFYRSWDLGRIHVLCDSCHRDFHAKRGKTAYGFSEDADPNYWREAARTHDAHPEECPWCSRRQALTPSVYGTNGFNFNASDRMPF